eukprot:7505702-Lingulodinium_polyedra.AAC.1
MSPPSPTSCSCSCTISSAIRRRTLKGCGVAESVLGTRTPRMPLSFVTLCFRFFAKANGPCTFS